MTPNHWTSAKLADVCSIKDGQRVPINREERAKRIADKPQSELYPYYGATGQVGWIDGYLFDGVHVLLGEDGAPFHDPTKAKAYIAAGKYWVNNHAHILEPHIEARFLCHYLNQIQYHDHVTGTTRLKLNQKAMKAISVRVAPLVEQRAIVAKIEALFSELDKGVEQLEQVTEQLKRYRQAVLKAAFEGKLTAEWRAQQQAAGTLPSAEDLLDQIQAERAARYAQQLADWKQAVEDWEAAGGKSSGQKKPRKPAKPEEAGKHPAEICAITSIPKEWKICTVSDLGTVVRGGSPRPAGDPKYFGGPIPWITVGAITADGSKCLTRVTEGITELGMEKSRFVEVGTFLLTNSGATLGVPKITLVAGCINDGSVALLHIQDSLKDYLYWFLTSKTDELRGLNQGAAQPNLNTGIVRRIAVPLCTAEEEMLLITKELESRFSVLDELEKAVEAGVKQAEALRQSILKKAFEGRLLSEAELAAVQADPAYEPAEKLLERIRAEREQSGTGTKRGRKGGKGKTARLPKVSGPERYKQAAYAAYAVQRLAGRETFGRVQQMKLVYLIPHALAQESKVYARREAAGPLDPAIRKIEGLAKRKDWFTTRKIGQRYKYTPGAKIDEAVEFAKDKFGDKADRVDWLLEQFARFDTERAELLATTFAVWNDHLIDGHDPSEDEIVAGVHGWHPEKVTKFPPDRIAKCIQWMKDNSFVPTGIGPKTTEGMAAE
jgi:type I restriction enzyme S subunit